MMRAIFLLLTLAAAPAADQPQWGRAWSRNLVSDERGLPDSFDPMTGKNIKWRVPLGGETHSTPVIAGGRVYIGTSNATPRDSKQEGDRGVLLCLDEKDGALRWQLLVPKRDDDKYFDWPKTGISSPATVEGERVYVMTNRHQVLCLDAQGMANGNDGPFRDEARLRTPHAASPPEFLPVLAPEAKGEVSVPEADVLWMFDLPSAAGIWPHDGAHTSILIHGDFLYVNTGTGVDNSHAVIRTPDAPSLIVLDKNTGRYVARDREQIAPRIFHSTWSSPSLATVGGRELIFFCGGDGIVRAFEPFTGAASSEVARLKQAWSFDPDPNAPKENVARFLNNRAQGPSNIYGMPVFADGRLYVAGGGDVFWGKNEAWLKCLDPVTAKELWSYPLDRHTLTTPTVTDGLVFASDTSRHIHCVEAATGAPVWVQDTRGDFWSSPLVADGKVFIGSRKGDYWIMAANREKKVLATIELGAPMSATTTATNGVLYIATMRELFAVAAKAE